MPRSVVTYKTGCRIVCPFVFLFYENNRTLDLGSEMAEFQLLFKIAVCIAGQLSICFLFSK